MPPKKKFRFRRGKEARPRRIQGMRGSVSDAVAIEEQGVLSMTVHPVKPFVTDSLNKIEKTSKINQRFETVVSAMRKSGRHGMSKTGNVSSSSCSSDSCVNKGTRKVFASRSGNAGLPSNNEGMTIEILEMQTRCSFAKAALADAVNVRSLRVQNVGTQKWAEVVPLDGATALLDDAEGCPTVGVDRCSKERLSVATVNRCVGFQKMTTSLLTPTAVASVSGIQNAADPAITGRSLMKTKAGKLRGIGCNNTEGRRTTKRSNKMQLSSWNDEINRHTPVGEVHQPREVGSVSSSSSSSDLPVNKKKKNAENTVNDGASWMSRDCEMPVKLSERENIDSTCRNADGRGEASPSVSGALRNEKIVIQRKRWSMRNEKCGHRGMAKTGNVSSSSSSSDWCVNKETKKVFPGKRGNTGLTRNNGEMIVEMSETERRCALAKPRLGHAVYAPSLRVRNLTVGPENRAEVVPLDGATALADDAGGCPAVGVDRCTGERLSVAAQNCGVGLLKTSLVTPTAMASVSSLEYAAESAITERSVMENKGAKSSGIVCDNTGGRRTTKRSNKRQFSSGNEERNRHTTTGDIQQSTLCFKETELLAVDKKGMPQPISPETISEITGDIFKRFHETYITCAVCNQFARISKSKLLPVAKLPIKMFTLLRTPSRDSGDLALPLHPVLVKQYDVSGFFPDEPRFVDLLLSPDGVMEHVSTCIAPNDCRCSPQIYMCDESTTPSCFRTLKRGKLPKLAIANGNWVGQLPPDLRNMSFGTRSLMRPVQTFGRITAFTGTTGPGGSSLKGHVYCTKLESAAVVKKVPISPGQTPVRVLVVSPFTSDAAAFYKGKIASTKADYIIEPTKIKALYQFWRDVDNDVVENINFDEESFLQLPEDAVSPDVFLVEKDGLKQVVEEMHGTESRLKKTFTTGGDSLLRSIDEEMDATMISSTITIGDNGNASSNGNEHEQLIDLLPTVDHPCAFDASSNMFVVRPGQEFVSDSMPKYLETLYPDLFPFGRGGFDENRSVRVSNKALVAYFANLSSRQFQHVDFALPVYDYIARRASSTMARIRAYLPSRIGNPDGSVITRAEAYGRISAEDLKKATKYHIECVQSKLFGRRIPRPPESLNGLASTFFTDQKIANQTIQHSQAAAQKNRQDVYAAHANNGKAHIWLTISPDDAKSWQVLWFALGPAESRPHSDAIPLGSKRFAVLANHPVAAALNFQRILDIVIEDVIGWCQSKNRAYKRGGLFGVPKAWLRVVEEQSRLTLHTHMLIWLAGHGDIEKQLDDAVKLDDADSFSNFMLSGSPVIQTRHVSAVTDKLTENIASIIEGELRLPKPEGKSVLQCEVCADEKLKIASGTNLEIMRNIDRVRECQILLCDKCKRTVTVTQKLMSALQLGYARLGKPMPSDDDVDTLIWRSLREKPPVNKRDEVDLWTLDLASIHLRVNQHDWRHRKSCFKNRRNTCRYGIPPVPTEVTQVQPVYVKNDNSSEENETVLPGSQRISELLVNVKKRVPYIFLTDCNAHIMSVLNCNNCVKYVKDQKVSMYYGAYSTKHSADCEQALNEALRSIEKYGEKINKQQEKADKAVAEYRRQLEENDGELDGAPFAPRRSDFSIGLGKLLSGVRASTKGDTIGGPLAAFVLLGNNIFAMSHQTEILPLAQAVGYLERENIHATITRFGEVRATIHDYVFRCTKTPHIETMNFWNFVRTQEICKLDVKTTNQTDGDCSSDRELEPASTRTIYGFSPGHPQYRHLGHRARTVTRWTKYLAKRLPDLHDLEDDSNLLAEQREERRIEYAKGVLTMFVPFREKIDLIADGETWWGAYTRHKPSLYSDEDIKQTLDSIQNFYESFCHSTPEAEALDFAEPDLQQLAKEENETIENNDEEYSDIDIEKEDDVVEEFDEIVSDPFIAALGALSQSPLDLPTRNWPSTVSNSNAKFAVDSLPSKKKNMFILPGRASLGFPIEESNPNSEISDIDTHLDQPLGTRIELLENLANALDSHTHEYVLSDGTEPEIMAQNFPSLIEQSRHWTLNREQHNAFLLMGAALMQHIYVTNRLSDLEVSQSVIANISKIKWFLDAVLPVNRQLALFLAGSGGTGKSRIIKCFKDFTRRWYSVASTVICASSGVAAMLIEGCTLHAALGVGITVNPANPNSQHKQAWSEVGILLVDEFSMITPSLFDLMEDRLRKLKVQLDKPFGGVHVILCGDFYQLPPVGTGPIYSTHAESIGRNGIKAANGRRCWKTCLTDVIELKQNHRQQDSTWASALERFRINQPTQEDINLVSSRYMFGAEAIEYPPKSTITAVPYNAMREKALRLCEQILLEKLIYVPDGDTNWRNQGVLLIQARVTPSRASKNLTISQQNDVRKLGSKKLGCSGNLYCVVDAPYMVMSNSDVAKGVSNGTLALLQDVVLKTSCVVALTKLPSGKKVHSVCASDVECLLFKHKNAAWTKVTRFPTLPEGWFPVVATLKTVECKFNSTFRSRMQILQFPCVLSLVLTGHKVQGISTDSIILGGLSEKDRSGATGWLYVILSRVKTLGGLFVMTNIEQNPVKYKVREDVQREMKRLHAIQLQTLARLEAVHVNILNM